MLVSTLNKTKQQKNKNKKQPDAMEAYTSAS